MSKLFIQTMNLLGEKLRAHRETKQLPLRKVAAAIDIDQAILSKIERGERYPTRHQIIELAKFFGRSQREKTS